MQEKIGKFHHASTSFPRGEDKDVNRPELPWSFTHMVLHIASRKHHRFVHFQVLPPGAWTKASREYNHHKSLQRRQCFVPFVYGSKRRLGPCRNRSPHLHDITIAEVHSSITVRFAISYSSLPAGLVRKDIAHLLIRL